MAESENWSLATEVKGTVLRERRVVGIREECSQEFQLPDYMGDVKRLLTYSASAIPCNKFTSGGEISFLSIVTFRVSYIDEAGVLTESCFTSDLEHSERVCPECVDARISTEVLSVSVRLKGPRRICARAALVSDVYVSERVNIPCCEDLPQSGDVLRKTTEIAVHSAVYPKPAEREYAEEIGRLLNISANDAQTVKCSLIPHVTSISAENGSVCIKGDMDAAAIIRTDEGIMRVMRRIPFEESILSDECDSDFHPRVNAHVTNTSVNLNNVVEDGTDGASYYTSVVLSATIEFHTVADSNKKYNVVTDAFVKGQKNKCEYENFKYEEMQTFVCERRKISLSNLRSEEDIREIIDTDVILKNVKKDICGSELKISGDAVVSIIASPNTGGECVLIKCEAPFEESIRIPGAADHGTVSLDLDASDCSVTFDAENVYAAVNLTVTAVVLAEKSIDLLVNMESTAQEKNNRRTVTVYYPCEGDTLWSVAKKYSASISDILKYNSLSGVSAEDTDASLSGAERIIIMET